MNRYPYTDMHEMNLDWILLKVKEMIAEWDTTKNAWNELKEFVETYFEDLDVQQEINNKLDEMAAGGELADLMAPYVDQQLPSVVGDQIADVVALQIGTVVAAQLPGVVTAQLPAIAADAAAAEVGTWLAAHIDPDTGYVIDDTLTTTDAAADAKVVGDTFKNTVTLRSNSAVTTGSLNDATFLTAGMWYIANTVADLPISGNYGNLIVFHNVPYGSTGATLQVYSQVDAKNLYVRYIKGSDWAHPENVAWVKIAASDEISRMMINRTATVSDFAASDLDTVRQTGIYYVSDTTVQNLPEATAGILIVFSGISQQTSTTGSKVQVYVTANGITYTRFIRANDISGWIKNRIADDSPRYNLITVNGNGGADFTKIKDALDSITDSSALNRYVVRIVSGTYDVLDELGGSAFLASIVDKSNVRLGLQVPSYVRIEGIGTVKIRLLPADNLSDENTTACISAFEVRGEAEFDNLEITVKNCRYAIHDEGSNASQYRNMKHSYRNLIVEHQGNSGVTGGWVSCAAIASGSSSGSEYVYENCIFKSATYYPWSMHNYGSQARQDVIIDGCKFEGSYSGGSLKFGYYQTGSEDNYVFLKNALATGNVKVVPESNQTPCSDEWTIVNFTGLTVDRT